MSLLQLFTNNAISLLDADLGASGTVIQLQPGAGSAFPLPSAPGEFFLVTLEDVANPMIREIIRVTERLGDVLICEPSGRAQENSTARIWTAANTLVDHRITAETIRQAFLQPTPTSGGGSGTPLVVADENATLTSTAARLNFVGAGVTATASGNNVTITIPGSSGGGSGGNPLAVADEGGNLTTAATRINFTGAGVTAIAAGTDITVNIPGGGSGGAGAGGFEYTPVVVIPTQNEAVGVVTYSDFRRGNKFWVSMVDPVSGNAQSFEVLTIIQGHISANTETVTWTRTNRIGYNFLGVLDVLLNKPLNELSVRWRNTEPTAAVVVTVVRI